jgi:hypothetical protein
MEFTKYFYKETDKTHRYKIKVTYKDIEQERECGDVHNERIIVESEKTHIRKARWCTSCMHML